MINTVILFATGQATHPCQITCYVEESVIVKLRLDNNNSYFIGSHEKSLHKLLKLKNDGKLTQTDVTTALAEHLLSKLSPGQSYTIDKRQRDKSCNIICKCGCGATLKFGYTGIGKKYGINCSIFIILIKRPYFKFP